MNVAAIVILDPRLWSLAFDAVESGRRDGEQAHAVGTTVQQAEGGDFTLVLLPASAGTIPASSGRD